MCIHNIMYNIRTHYVHTHTKAPNIGWGPHANASNKSTILCIYIYLCVCVFGVCESGTESEGVLPGLYYN